MAAIPGGFNSEEVEPNISFEALPADWYDVMIIESEMKETKAGNGHYLELKEQVISGPYEGRFVWDRLNLDNPNETAVQIARATLSAICRAVSLGVLRDSTELHNLPLQARVAQKLYEGEARNEIKGYRSKDPAAAAVPAKPATPPAKVGPAATPPATAAKKASAPWGAVARK
jgi:hypothetical protein